MNQILKTEVGCPVLTIICHKCGQSFEVSSEQYQQALKIETRLKCIRCSVSDSEKGQRLGWQRRLTASESLLLAVDKLKIQPHFTIAGVTRSAIVVEMWMAERKRFGLLGFENEYPDSNRVTVELVRSVRSGELKRPLPGRYSLTARGVSAVFDLKEQLRTAAGK